MWRQASCNQEAFSSRRACLCVSRGVFMRVGALQKKMLGSCCSLDSRTALEASMLRRLVTSGQETPKSKTLNPKPICPLACIHVHNIPCSCLHLYLNSNVWSICCRFLFPYTHTCIYIYVYTYCKLIHTHIYIYIYIYICVFRFTCSDTYMSLCICTYV